MYFVSHTKHKYLSGPHTYNFWFCFVCFVGVFFKNLEVGKFPVKQKDHQVVAHLLLYIQQDHSEKKQYLKQTSRN